jgi:IS5 family transposase
MSNGRYIATGLCDRCVAGSELSWAALRQTATLNRPGAIHFGMKAHIGVDADSGLVHTVRGIAGSANDVVEANTLLHGQETEAWDDAGYQGAGKHPDAKEGVR